MHLSDSIPKRHIQKGQRYADRSRDERGLKTITTRWPTGIRAGAEFVMPTMS
jgi:hypothetical protein